MGILLNCLLSILPILATTKDAKPKYLPSDESKDMNSFGKYSDSQIAKSSYPITSVISGEHLVYGAYTNPDTTVNKGLNFHPNMVTSKFNKVVSLSIENENNVQNLYLQITFYNDLMVWEKNI